MEDQQLITELIEFIATMFRLIYASNQISYTMYKSIHYLLNVRNVRLRQLCKLSHYKTGLYSNNVRYNCQQKKTHWMSLGVAHCTYIISIFTQILVYDMNHDKRKKLLHNSLQF